jgi:hypothetical protein
MHCCHGIEGLRGKHNFSAVTKCCEQSERQSEAVEQWWRTAEYVLGCEIHAITDEARVVDEITVVKVRQRIDN